MGHSGNRVRRWHPIFEWKYRCCFSCEKIARNILQNVWKYNDLSVSSENTIHGFGGGVLSVKNVAISGQYCVIITSLQSLAMLSSSLRLDETFIVHIPGWMCLSFRRAEDSIGLVTEGDHRSRRRTISYSHSIQRQSSSDCNVVQCTYQVFSLFKLWTWLVPAYHFILDVRKLEWWGLLFTICDNRWCIKLFTVYLNTVQECDWQ